MINSLSQWRIQDFRDEGGRQSQRWRRQSIILAIFLEHCMESKRKLSGKGVSSTLWIHQCQWKHRGQHFTVIVHLWCTTFVHDRPHRSLVARGWRLHTDWVEQPHKVHQWSQCFVSRFYHCFCMSTSGKKVYIKLIFYWEILLKLFFGFEKYNLGPSNKEFGYNIHPAITEKFHCIKIVWLQWANSFVSFYSM